MWQNCTGHVYRLLGHLTVAALLLCASVVPGLTAKATSEIDKAKSPIEVEEESLAKFEGLFESNHRRVRDRQVRPAFRSAKPLLAVHVRSRIRENSAHLCVEGHHLANGLLAPLTC
jgi:hypothetical protein